MTRTGLGLGLLGPSRMPLQLVIRAKGVEPDGVGRPTVASDEQEIVAKGVAPGAVGKPAVENQS